MKKESEDKVTNYCMESGLALTTVFSNYTVDDLKNMCKASDIEWIKNMSNLERILKRLDKNQSAQSTDNKQFHKEYEKIESEYNKDVKSWQEQEKQEQEQIEMKKTEKRTKMKTKKSAKKTEDKED